MLVFLLDGSQRVDFGMSFTAANVIALSNDTSVVYDYGADHGIWSGVLESVAGKLYATAHEKFIKFQFTIYFIWIFYYLGAYVSGA